MVGPTCHLRLPPSDYPRRRASLSRGLITCRGARARQESPYGRRAPAVVASAVPRVEFPLVVARTWRAKPTNGRRRAHAHPRRISHTAASSGVRAVELGPVVAAASSGARARRSSRPSVALHAHDGARACEGGPGGDGATGAGRGHRVLGRRVGDSVWRSSSRSAVGGGAHPCVTNRASVDGPRVGDKAYG